MNTAYHISASYILQHPLVVGYDGSQISVASFTCFCNRLYYLSNFKDFNN
jgi:hypothetical protein